MYTVVTDVSERVSATDWHFVRCWRGSEGPEKLLIDFYIYMSVRAVDMVFVLILWHSKCTH